MHGARKLFVLLVVLAICLATLPIIPPPISLAQDGTVACGQQVTGTLTLDHTQEFWSLEIDESMWVYITMRATNGNLDSLLFLYDPSGVELDHNDDGAGGLDSLLELVLPTPGTYSIEARSLVGFGDYTLSVTCNPVSVPPESDAPAFSGELPVGEFLSGEAPISGMISYDTPVSGVISDATPLHYYQFAGRAGDAIVISQSDTGDETLDCYVILYGPDGNEVDHDDDGGDGYNSALPVTLPADGTYTVLFTRYYRGDGSSYGPFVGLVSQTGAVADPNNAASPDGQSTSYEDALAAAELLYEQVEIYDDTAVEVMGPVPPGSVISEQLAVNFGEWEEDYEGWVEAVLEVPYGEGPYYVFFINDAPLMRFDHPVRYAWLDLASGEYDLINANRRFTLQDAEGIPYDSPDLLETTVYGVPTFVGSAVPIFEIESWPTRPPVTAGLSTTPVLRLDPDAASTSPLQQSQPINGRRVALVVDGGGDYASTFSNIANQMGRYLRTYYSVRQASQYRLSAYAPLELYDTSIPRSQNQGLDDSLNYYANLLTCPTADGEDHEFFLYLGGHGDAKNFHLYNMAGTGFAMIRYDRELRPWLARFGPCVRIIVFIDACYSGGAITGSNSLRDLCTGRPAGVTIMTAADDQHNAWAGALYDSATEDFLEVTEDLDGDGTVGDLRDRWLRMESESYSNAQLYTCPGQTSLGDLD